MLFGGKDLSGGFHPGERIAFGAWLNASQTLGVEASYLQINRQTEFFNTSGVSTPILARPFFNSETGQQDSQIINFPGQQSGTFSSASSSDLQVAEVLFRKNLNHQPGFAFDLVAGYRYQQLEDHLAVDDTLTFSGTQSSFPAGSIVQQSDRFDTRNVFQGGEIGMSTTLHRQCWSIDTLLKIAVGQTHSRVTIEGATATTIPGQTATLLPGGLLALPSNIGVHDSDQFSVVPELGVTLGFDLSPQLRATIGYDLVYWTAVARPGDQIDLNIDPRQFPPAAITGATRPEFILHTSDYWAQGLNLGLGLAVLVSRVEDQRNLPFLTAADDADRHLLAGTLALDRLKEIVGRLDRFSVDAHDQVGRRPIDRLILVDERPLAFLLPHDFRAAQPGTLGGTAGRNRGDQQPLVGLIDPHDARLRPPYPALVDQLRHDAGDRAHGNGKAHAGALARLAGDRRIHADHPRMTVQERPAGIARIDRRIDLDDRLQRSARAATGQRAVQTGNDAGRQRSLQPERIADGKDPLADLQLRRIAEDRGKQRCRRGIDLQHRHVRGRILADQPGVVGVAVE